MKIQRDCIEQASFQISKSYVCVISHILCEMQDECVTFKQLFMP